MYLKPLLCLLSGLLSLYSVPDACHDGQSAAPAMQQPPALGGHSSFHWYLQLLFWEEALWSWLIWNLKLQELSGTKTALSPVQTAMSAVSLIAKVKGAQV